MWTNIFRIGDLSTISWFQFLPCESDTSTLSENSLKAEERDASTLSVLMAHLRLLSEGFLTTWTNSFVGPWDPSQGVHNPDEKIKLWLFLPGRHSSVADAAKSSVSRLKVVGSGIWLAPGDSEEVAFALSQSLRNRIERSLKMLSYERFGDVFARCHSFPSIEKNSRRVQPTFEFIFSATEEAIYVLAIISSKNVRGLSSIDLERASRHCILSASTQGLPVIVAPNGMGGRLNGCSPSDLVKQAYSSFSRSSSRSSALGTLQSNISPLRGHSSYVEVTLGCPSVGVEKSKSKIESCNNARQNQVLEGSSVIRKINEQKHCFSDHLPVEKTFIFPAEKVLVPVLHEAFAQFSFRRLWLQNWLGIYASDMQPGWSLSGGSFITHCLGFGCADDIKYSDNLFESRYTCANNGHNTSSSISSTSSTSSESDDTMASGACDLEGDSDSLTCRQSGLSSSDQFGTDGRKMVSKRSRSIITESLGQTGTPASGTSQDQYGADYSMDEGGNMVVQQADNQTGYSWDWGDEDKDVEVDIQSLLLDFGDFGDFFNDDILEIGEPPGATESQVPIFSAADCSDIICSPYSGRIDPSDQALLPSLSYPPLEEFNPQSSLDTFDRAMEIARDAQLSIGSGHITVASSGKYDHLTKAEALLTFASEYSAVEAPKSELSTSIFKYPYMPKCKSAESEQSRYLCYVYSATPPSSPYLPQSEDTDEISNMTRLGNEVQELTSRNATLKCYDYVESQKSLMETRSSHIKEMEGKGDAVSSVSIVNLPSSIVASQRKNIEKVLEAGPMLISPKILLATEVECSMFQASMCRIRHTLLSCNSQVPPFSRLPMTPISERVLGDSNIASMMPLSCYDLKKDALPVRIAGDADGMLERPFAAPVGVWRPVANTKGLKSSDVLNIESSSTLSSNMFAGETFFLHNQRLALQDFLDSLPLLVQQSTSFVDISLDACDREGPYDWLALNEQMRRGFCCGPSLVHAGCGGLLATCHSLDIAGVDLINPLTTDVHPSSVISLLQSDIKLALKSAFGNLDGPLSAMEWCKCHNQSGDIDMHSVECNAKDIKDPSSTLSFAGEPISPSTALSGVTSATKDGTRLEESSQRKANQELDHQSYRSKSSISVIPLPALLVGYQDDWLKTSLSSLKFWEKAPFEPYALPKPLTYYAICPDIDFLTSAATDFFLQLGTVYEACKLGTHSPCATGTLTDPASRKLNLSGLVLVDCPSSVKVGSGYPSPIGGVSDYLVALSKGWDFGNFLKSLTKVIKTLRTGPGSSTQKEGSGSPCTVIYVICPFPDPNAILQTLIEASAALGSATFASEREGQISLHSQVAKALNGASASDESVVPNVLMLSGFNIRKLVLQIITIDILLKVNKPMDDLAMFKEIAFTVYNKARRIPRPLFSNEIVHSSSLGRSQSTLMNVSSPTPGLWKDCLAPRMSGAQITREGELDSSMRHGSWDNSWQTLRTGILNCDPNKLPEFCPQDDLRYIFEPLFILAEPGTTEAGASMSNFGTSVPEPSRSMMDESTNAYIHNTVGASMDAGASHLNDGEHEQKTPNFHCCYGWTEDWRWLISIWTDARGELLDCHVFPFGGISSRQDTKVLQCLFVQILNQGCQVLSSLTCDSASSRGRDIVITRIGCFFELECQEWQKAIYSVGGNEIRKWPIHLRRSMSGIPTSNSSSLQQQDMNLLQERSIPSPPSALYSPHSKPSSYSKSGLGQNNPKKPLPTGQVLDNSRGLFQMVQSISLVGVMVDHSLQFVCPADSFVSGGGSQTSSSSNVSGYLDGFTSTKSLGTSSHSFLFMPSVRMCCLPPNPLQLPTCLTSESPPLAHLLHSKGSAIPVSTAYVVSKAIPNVQRGLTGNASEEWPSILSVNLVDYYGASTNYFQDKVSHGGGGNVSIRQVRNPSLDNGREHEVDIHMVLESVAAELHALSWLTVSPAYPERRTALPFHCDTLLRLRRLLHYADKQLCQLPAKRE